FRPAEHVEDAIAGGKVLPCGPLRFAACALLLEPVAMIVLLSVAGLLEKLLESIVCHPRRYGEGSGTEVLHRQAIDFVARIGEPGRKDAGQAGAGEDRWQASWATASRWAVSRRRRSLFRICRKRSNAGWRTCAPARSSCCPTSSSPGRPIAARNRAPTSPSPWASPGTC